MHIDHKTKVKWPKIKTKNDDVHIYLFNNVKNT